MQNFRKTNEQSLNILRRTEGRVNVPQTRVKVKNILDQRGKSPKANANEIKCKNLSFRNKNITISMITRFLFYIKM